MHSEGLPDATHWENQHQLGRSPGYDCRKRVRQIESGLVHIKGAPICTHPLHHAANATLFPVRTSRPPKCGSTSSSERPRQNQQGDDFSRPGAILEPRLYWNCFRPSGGGKPAASLKEKIDGAFASVDACKKALSAAAVAELETRDVNHS